ncbi:MAG: radical SAM protein [Candidatus Aenigmatarchaeota archaeon]|nr:MAG: radical SAM protein [Candidatus Aenigmarchaeota archaeon]
MIRSFLNLLTGRPTLCVYDLTTRCNSRCAFCSIWKRREKEMNLKEIEKVFTDLKRFGIHTIFLQGGEPLVHSNFLEVTDMLVSMGFHVNVISNGILMSENMISKLDDMNIRGRIKVTISLDTLDRKKYEKIRGVDRLDAVLKNIRSLAECRSLEGGVHATVTSINYTELEDLRKLIHDLGLDFSFNTYNDVKNYASAGDRSLSLKNSRKVEKIIAEIEKLKERMPRLYRPFISDNIRYMRGEDVGPCDAFIDSFRVTSEGMLTPCLELPPFYDLKKQDISREWKDFKKRARCPIERCYTRTPCFYGCTRGMGSVKRNPPTAIVGFFSVISNRA